MHHVDSGMQHEVSSNSIHMHPKLVWPTESMMIRLMLQNVVCSDCNDNISHDKMHTIDVRTDKIPTRKGMVTWHDLLLPTIP